MQIAGRAIPVWPALVLAGFSLFPAGLTLLHLNPCWRAKPGSEEGAVDNLAYIWSGLSHLVAGLGLAFCIGGIATAGVLFLSKRFTSKRLFCGGAVLASCEVIAWLALGGMSVEHWATFRWDSESGVTAFQVTDSQQKSHSPLWLELVRWQVEPDLNGYMGSGGNLASADGGASIKVVRIVPIAMPIALGSDGEVLRNTKRKHPPPGARRTPAIE